MQLKHLFIYKIITLIRLQIKIIFFDPKLNNNYNYKYTNICFWTIGLNLKYTCNKKNVVDPLRIDLIVYTPCE